MDKLNVHPVDKLVQFLAVEDKPWQLVKHKDDVPLGKRSYPVWVEIKYDGVFCAVVMGSFMPVAISRTGKEFYSAINAKLLPLVPPDVETQQVIIGELVCTGISLEELSGLVNPNRVTPYTPEQEEMLKGVDYFVHDVLTFQEVYNGYSQVKQRDRRKRVEALHPRVARATGMMIHDLVEENIFFNEAMAHDCEGIVLKNPNADYEAGHKGWRAMKRVRDLHVDLKCLAVETGKGKRTGQIARLQFMYKGKLFWADLGKGWTDEKRDALTRRWWSEQRDHPAAGCWPVNKIFHLSALQESSKGVLRLPKVNEIRIDKDVEDVT